MLQLNQYRKMYGHLLTDNSGRPVSRLLILLYRSRRHCAVNLIIPATAFNTLASIGDHHAATHLDRVPR